MSYREHIYHQQRVWVNTMWARRLATATSVVALTVGLAFYLRPPIIFVLNTLYSYSALSTLLIGIDAAMVVVEALVVLLFTLAIWRATKLVLPLFIALTIVSSLQAAAYFTFFLCPEAPLLLCPTGYLFTNLRMLSLLSGVGLLVYGLVLTRYALYPSRTRILTTLVASLEVAYPTLAIAGLPFILVLSISLIFLLIRPAWLIIASLDSRKLL